VPADPLENAPPNPQRSNFDFRIRHPASDSGKSANPAVNRPRGNANPRLPPVGWRWSATPSRRPRIAESGFRSPPATGPSGPGSTTSPFPEDLERARETMLRNIEVHPHAPQGPKDPLGACNKTTARPGPNTRGSWYIPAGLSCNDKKRRRLPSTTTCLPWFRGSAGRPSQSLVVFPYSLRQAHDSRLAKRAGELLIRTGEDFFNLCRDGLRLGYIDFWAEKGRPRIENDRSLCHGAPSVRASPARIGVRRLGFACSITCKRANGRRMALARNAKAIRNGTWTLASQSCLINPLRIMPPITPPG